MYLRLRPLTVAIFLTILLLPAGCSRSRHDAAETYYLVATNIKLAYWQAALEGLNRSAADLKLTAELVGPETYDPEEQRRIFRQTVEKKPAGIMVSAANPELMRPEIDNAIGSGIPVITMDSDSPNSRRLFFVGTNNYQAGLTGGHILTQRLAGRGNVIVFTIPTQANLIERLRGYEESLAGTGIKIVRTVDVRGDAAVAFDQTMEIVESGKLDVDGFVCLEATAGKEVAEVLSRRNIQGKTIVAMDTDEGTLNWIEKGMITATVAQKPFTMAYYGLRLLDDLHHNKPANLNSDWRQNLHALVPAVVDTGSSLVTRENLSTIRQAVRRPGRGMELAWFGSLPLSPAR